LTSPLLTLTPRSAPRAGWRRATGLAAAGLLLALGGAGLWRATRDTVPQGARVAEAPLREFATKPGQRATISLVDGTTVTLGVASTLRVRPYDRAAPGPRDVYLEGEAVFDVAHDERRPFFVHSKGAVTEDLGTRFGVRAYSGDTLVRVVVAEGRVALRTAAAPAGSGALLGPGDLGRLDDAGRAVVERGVDAATYLAWTDGRLVFREAPLGEVATQLGRWFDVTIDVPAGVAKRRVTLDMPARALTDVLDAVTVPLGLRYAYDRPGRTVRVAP
jgi:transmembrane sensor